MEQNQPIQTPVSSASQPNPVPTPPSNTTPLQQTATAATSAPNIIYAGFWKRFAAIIIDTLIVFIPFFILRMLIDFITLLIFRNNSNQLAISVEFFFGFLIIQLLNILWFACFESSHLQATPGKLALGIIVTDMQGHKLSFKHAFGREAAKLINGFGAILFLVGAIIPYTLAAWTPKKQALHDLIAQTLVIKK